MRKAKPANQDPKYEEWVNEGFRMYRIGYDTSRVKERLMRDMGMKYHFFPDVKMSIKKRITDAMDIYGELAKELNTDRLNSLLEGAIEQQDGRLALDIIKEINKLHSLYTQKVQIENVEYRLNF